MKIEYGVKVPKSDREDVNAIYSFADGQHNTMKLTYADVKEARNSLQVIKRLVEKEGWSIDIKRMNEVVFLEKTAE